MAGVVAKVLPSTYVQWYKAIDVLTSAGLVRSASVQRYLCNLPQYGGIGDSPVFWQSILIAAKAGKIFYREDQLAGASQCFWGKGTPDDVAHALRVVEDVALAMPNHPALQPFRDVLSGDDRVAKVCEKYIGLDCNGFIGNFGKENGLPSADPNLVPNLWANVGPRNEWRSSVDQIKPLDVLIWPAGAHIAIIDSIQGSQFTICQATGGSGPQTSSGHAISAAKKDAENRPQFLVGAGLGKYGPPPATLPATVRIKSIGFA